MSDSTITQHTHTHMHTHAHTRTHTHAHVHRQHTLHLDLSPHLVFEMLFAVSHEVPGAQGTAATRKSSEGKFGVSHLNLPPGLLADLVERDLVHVCPNGVMFCKREVRGGVLPVMLDEILRTRIMVKQSMKEGDATEAMRRLMNARQLGLKLIANVTYGYTSATFSGRMPCVDIADSIVQSARETLTRAMRMVEANPRWNAKVVYGDTDSMFVLLRGATKDQAFTIGQEIVDAVTAANPPPVKLKFEKVYLPCILQTKKRFVAVRWAFVSP